MSIHVMSPDLLELSELPLEHGDMLTGGGELVLTPLARLGLLNNGSDNFLIDPKLNSVNGEKMRQPE